MLLNGKKTERVLMRVSEEMAQQIRALAELGHRTIQDQTRFLIAVGLNQSWGVSSNGTEIPDRQLASTAPDAAPPMSIGVNFRQPASRKTA